MTIVLSSNQYGAAQSVQRLGYTLEDQRFKSLHKQETNLLSKTSRPAPAPTQPPTPQKTKAFSLAVKWPVQTLTTHNHLQPSLKIIGAIPTINLSPSMAHIGTTSLYLYLQPTYISLNRSHPFWSYKRTFLYITYPLHAHYMNHLLYLH